MQKSITPFVLGLIKKGNKFLLTKRLEIDREDPKEFEGKWQIPGGGINFAETVEEALKREIREELGVEIEIIRMVPQIIDSIRRTWHGVGIVYLCKLKDENAKIMLNSESSEFGWFSLNEIEKLEMLPGGKEVIKTATILS